MAGVGAGILSPSLLNLFVGKAFVTFQRQYPVAIADAAPVHLGLLSDIDYTPDIPIIRYVNETGGIAYVAQAQPQMYGGKAKITLNELTIYNLGLLLQGNPDYSTPSAPKLLIYGLQAALTGQLIITMTNGTGPRHQLTITNALLTPAEAFKPVSKEYGNLVLNMEHLADQNGEFGTSILLPDVNSIVPTNITAPFITTAVASTSPKVPAGGTPAAATVGIPCNCNSGQWTYGVGGNFTFQWYTNTTAANTGGTIISGATKQNFTPVSGDIGKYLYCVVTVTNTVGPTSTPSGVTQTVAS
jgi:hypothetical protein